METNYKPLVAIVGRPNVGKSTLFNRITGMQKAIVQDMPGVTRDRLYADADWDGREFQVVDTGGLDPDTKDYFLALVKDQIDVALSEADLIVVVLDGKAGLMPQDKEVLKLLRKTNKPVLYAINKIDSAKHEINLYEFAELGIDDFIMISASHGRNVDALLDRIVEIIPQKQAQFVQSEHIKVSILGKPNVGKSTLLNMLSGKDRMITSPVPGTTRDSIDCIIKHHKKQYLFVDTAGIRRRSKIDERLEQITVSKAISTIERSDVVLLMIDGQQGPTHQDCRIADLITSKGKGCIILLNKWDLVPAELAQTPGIQDKLLEQLKGIVYAPVIIISALKGKNVSKIFSKIEQVYANLNRKLNTNNLNNYLQQLMEATPPPLFKGKETKIYYISQTNINPPTFVMFTNRTKGFPDHYKNFLENRFREKYDLEGVPIRLIFRSRKDRQ
ncbi:MAG: ribosome biogenesis GTPase Der [Candidatus Dadabacteria bacterium]|nr:ribosome biogenesis GTPase Der [Candidatus Dadabacteria bacterium]NIS09296.1 ribosome biogenesis GTPase Der [Candidatus Dadabacteria bacterium]NIV40786.1 ribosome biogenesis GTPase Der [Candidatus Dadabacteria bacterium]NIX14295.1 ribosome biogenesis GTPase Der [Candidatus Dadabacteria bacterium]NIY20828.1 ribosome biogenesis GTPase Der [Candidatus Dadabacteria bacterium]